MVYRLLYKVFVWLGLARKTPVVVRGGKINRLVMEDNIVVGAELVDAKQLTNASINRNRISLPAPKDIPRLLNILIDFGVALFATLGAAYLVYKFGWNQ